MAKHYENHSTVVSLVHSPEVMSYEDVKENDDTVLYTQTEDLSPSLLSTNCKQMFMTVHWLSITKHTLRFTSVSK